MATQTDAYYSHHFPFRLASDKKNKKNHYKPSRIMPKRASQEAGHASDNKRRRKSKEELNELSNRICKAVLTHEQMEFPAGPSEFMKRYDQFFHLEYRHDYAEFSCYIRSYTPQWKSHVAEYRNLYDDNTPKNRIEFCKDHFINGDFRYHSRCLSLALRLHEYKEKFAPDGIALPEPEKASDDSEKEAEEKDVSPNTMDGETKKPPSDVSPTRDEEMKESDGGDDLQKVEPAASPSAAWPFSSIWGYMKKAMPWSS